MMDNHERWAVAQILGDEQHSVLSGTVRLESWGENTLVIADIWGLPDSETGFFAFHIHEGGSCGGENLADTGSHYDPENVPHPRHAGDLPPLLSCGGHAYLAVLTDRFRVADIVGRTAVIHSYPDDFKTQPAGNAGSKIACGVIRWG